MIWKIECYNGTTWLAPYQMLLTEAIEIFIKETKLVQWDIKYITNLH